jgi:glycopeptide antibiotics resistance protein
MYFLLALRETLFPIFISGELAEARTQVSFAQGVNLIPLYFGRSLDTENIILGIFQNIILTMPLGFGLSFVWQMNKQKIVLGVIIGGLGFEALQLIISMVLGYPYRVLDINDVLCNVAGALIGYGLFRIFAWLYLLATLKFDIVHKGLSLYIYNVCNQTQTFAKGNRA